MPRKFTSVIDAFGPDSPFATEFRRLLHQVRHSPRVPELKTLMITSSMLGEGKSTITAFLGITAARQKGLKTLIVDTDLRRPTIHRLFNVERKGGLAEVLIDGFTPLDAAQKTAIDKLDVITSGRVAESAADVFDAEAIGCLLDDLRLYYDLILIDCAPLVPVSDPMLLAGKVDGIAIVIKAGETPREVVRRGVEVLGDDRKRIVGVVVNNLRNMLPYYYDYSYYGYEYFGKSSTADHGDKGTKKEKGPDTRSRKKAPGNTADNALRQQ
jgi:protein-tyrosine kinase